MHAAVGRQFPDASAEDHLPALLAAVESVLHIAAGDALTHAVTLLFALTLVT